MHVDPERVEGRLTFIKGEVEALRRLLEAHADPASILQDPWKRRGVRYALQTAIEAVADVAYHLCAKGFSHAPSDPHDAVDRLQKAAVISQDLASRLHGMVGLRNRLVHGYVTVDDERLLSLIRAGLGDFDQFVEAVERLVRKPPGAQPT